MIDACLFALTDNLKSVDESIKTSSLSSLVAAGRATATASAQEGVKAKPRSASDEPALAARLPWHVKSGYAEHLVDVAWQLSQSCIKCAMIAKMPMKRKWTP